MAILQREWGPSCQGSDGLYDVGCTVPDSRYLDNEYLAKTMLVIPYIEVRSSHSIGAWTL